MKYSNERLTKWKTEINAGPIIATRINIRREGNEWKACCPFHKNGQERTPSFTVYKLDDGTWGFKCFGCGENGNVFQFIERFDKVPFTKAVQIVLDIAGTVDPAELESKPTAPKKITAFSITEYEQAEHALEKSTAGQKWLEARGITMESASRFHLGFVQDAVAVCGTEHPWRKNGWILIPTLSANMEAVFAVKYRSLVGKNEMVDGKPVCGIRRAQNTGTMLFNLREVNDLEDVFIAEGEPDAIVLSQTGTPAVGLPFAGYSPMVGEWTILKQAKRRFLAGDMDDSGVKARNRFGNELGANTFVILWPKGCKDATDALVKRCGGDHEKFTALLDDLKGAALPYAASDTNPPASVESNTSESDEAVIVVAGYADMPRTVLCGRLGELCERNMLADFPVAYAWPSVVTAASVLVPEPSPDQLHNLYLALVGPVNNGKSQAIEWALKSLDVQSDPTRYSEVKAGSAERLLKHLNKLARENQLGPRVLIFMDEWKYFFDKASIEGATFPTLLTTGFYHRNVSILDSHGNPLLVPASLSWAGGIVDEAYDECFSRATALGLQNRFLQGISPTDYAGFQYRPFDGVVEDIQFDSVSIDRSVWQRINEWRKANPSATREAEIAVRVAYICASADGAPVLYGKDLDPHLILAAEQMRVREKLKANVGETPDAQCAIRVENYLKANAPHGEWVNFRALMLGIHYARFGPGVFDRTIQCLVRLDIVRLGQSKLVGSEQVGRPAKLIRLAVENDVLPEKRGSQ